jgi:GNAT superfamily N-acetyltransferase
MAHASPLPPGVVRPAGPADLPALRALVDRCSFDTLYRRFHGATGAPLRRAMARVACADGDAHRSWVAVVDGTLRGVATLARSRSGEVEAAFLVEDAWQRRGVGRALAARLRAEARRSGLASLTAMIQGDNTGAVRFARAVAPGVDVTFDGAAEYRLAIPVPPPVSRAGRARSPRRPAPSGRTR